MEKRDLEKIFVTQLRVFMASVVASQPIAIGSCAEEYNSKVKIQKSKNATIKCGHFVAPDSEQPFILHIVRIFRQST